MNNNLFAALETATGLVKAGHYERRPCQEFLDFMNGVIDSYDNEKEIHVILDNLNPHKPKNDRWLKSHPNVIELGSGLPPSDATFGEPIAFFTALQTDIKRFSFDDSESIGNRLARLDLILLSGKHPVKDPTDCDVSSTTRTLVILIWV